MDDVSDSIFRPVDTNEETQPCIVLISCGCVALQTLPPSCTPRFDPEVLSDEPYKRVENGIEEDRKIYFSAKVSDS